MLLFFSFKYILEYFQENIYNILCHNRMSHIIKVAGILYILTSIGQWSITNPTGKKVYSKLFLLQLGIEAVCQKKPDILKTWSNITKSSNQPQYNQSGVSSIIKMFVIFDEP